MSQKSENNEDFKDEDDNNGEKGLAWPWLLVALLLAALAGSEAFSEVLAQIGAGILVLFLLLVAFGPALLLLFYFAFRDRFEPEPEEQLARVVHAGIWAAFVAAGVELGLEFLLFLNDEFAQAVVIAPLVEEPAKLLAVLLTVYRTKDFNEPMDGIVYAAAAALGFAAAENFFYLLEALGVELGAIEGEAGFVPTLVVRTLLSVPGHALFTALPGAALGIGLIPALQDSPATRQLLLLGGLGLAMVSHGLFNYITFVSENLWIAVALLSVQALVLWGVVHLLMAWALAHSPFRPAGEPASFEAEARRMFLGGPEFLRMRGRIGRGAWWGIQTVAALLGLLLERLVAEAGVEPRLLIPVGVLLAWVVAAAYVNRWRDRRRPAWMALIPLASLAAYFLYPHWATMLLLVGGGGWALIELGFREGAGEFETLPKGVVASLRSVGPKLPPFPSEEECGRAWEALGPGSRKLLRLLVGRGPATAEEIQGAAAAVGVPRAFVAALLRRLSEGGYVRLTEGRYAVTEGPWAEYVRARAAEAPAEGE